MKIYNIPRREISQIINSMNESLTTEVEGKFKDAKVIKLEEAEVILIEERFQLVRKDGRIFPFLRDQDLLDHLPIITVDKGAIKFVCNGADIMRPGIVKLEGEFGKESIIAIKEESHGKFISVGLSIFSSEEIRASERGAMIKNLHFVGDRLWEIMKAVSVS